MNWHVVHAGDKQLSQVWYADDSSSGGKLVKIKEWLDLLIANGPKYGYFAKLSKTFLIIKNEDDFERAQELFNGYDIKITMSGKRHIGAALGTTVFKDEFVGKKVQNWCKDVEKLAIFADDEPQSALSAFTRGSVSDGYMCKEQFIIYQPCLSR